MSTTTKQSKNPNNKKNKRKHNMFPFVSVCTPTFNRRPFIEHMIKCFNHQDYPKSRIEWIIVDDGTDKIGDLVSHIPQVKYFSYEKKMTLGEKRNLMHTKCSGNIIVYMDDDDYYPPQRISHAVERLKATPTALCAGSSEIYIYFKHIDKLYQFGPYGPNHSTAGTFAFKKELLDITSYENGAALAEEKHFLKNYTIPFVQLDPLKTILVFSHEHNTFDKRKLLENQHPNFVKESMDKKVEMFFEKDVNKEEMIDFYVNKIEMKLKDYKPGRPDMKPDVLKQIIELEKSRKIEEEKMMALQQENMPKIMINMNGEQKILTIEQSVNLLQQQHLHINHLLQLLQGKDNQINLLISELTNIKSAVALFDVPVDAAPALALDAAPALALDAAPLALDAAAPLALDAAALSLDAAPLALDAVPDSTTLSA
jgi:glycosyltransferase involved in cell wall biosynthesis